MQVPVEHPPVNRRIRPGTQYAVRDTSYEIRNTKLEQLKKFRDSAAVIVAIGNALKGDDGAGPLVCERLKQAKISAELIDAGTVPENYIQRIVKKAPQVVLVIDAIDFGAPAGAVRIFEPEQLSSHVISTHTLSPRLFVDLVRGQAKLDVYFIGIQPTHVELGRPISQQVSGAVERLCEALTEVFPPVE